MLQQYETFSVPKEIKIIPKVLRFGDRKTQGRKRESYKFPAIREF